MTSALAEASVVALLGPRRVGNASRALEAAHAWPAVDLDLERYGN